MTPDAFANLQLAGGVTVHAGDGRCFEGDVGVHGAGCALILGAFDLSAGRVEAEHGRLKLDAHLRSVSNERVFAAGDAASRGPALTPIASLDADVVAKNLLDGCRHEPDHTGFGSAVFAIPQLAAVDLTEKGLDVEVRAADVDGFESVRREGHGASGTAYKVLVDKGSRAILGAHVYAPGAPDVVNLFALAVRLKMGEAQLGAVLSAYPSKVSDVSNMLR